MRALRLIAAPLLVVVAVAVPSVGWAQGITLDDYEVFDVDGLDEKYRVWVEEEVRWLITDREYDVFVRLDSDAKRDIFMEEFWKNRDPTPGTPRNEFYESHYERLAYANKFYGRGTSTDGWRTDRGRHHILLGEPQMKTRVASDMVTYPMEVWFYASPPDLGLPPFFYMVFYQRNGVGDYRVYSPLSDGPAALLNGAGVKEVENRQNDARRSLALDYNPTGFDRNAAAVYDVLREIDIDVASAAFSLFPSEAGLEFGISPLRSEMLIAQVDGVREVMMTDPTWAYNVLTGATESDVRFETLNMRAAAAAWIDTDGQPFLHFAAATEGEHLSMSEYEGRYYFAFDAVGSVATPDFKILHDFEANMSGELEAEQARQFSRNPFIYMDVIPAIPGRRDFNLMMQNKVARTFGRAEFSIDIPQAHPDAVEVIGPTLIAAVQQREYDPFAQRFAFQYGDLGMVPNIESKVYAGSPLYAFEQVLLPAEYDGAVTLRAELIDPTGSVVRSDEAQFAAADGGEHGVISHLWSFETEGLSVGAYSLRTRVVENDIERRNELQVVAIPEDFGQPFINAQPAPPPTDVAVAMERARQYRNLGDVDSAAVWLRDAMTRDPDNAELLAERIALLKDAGMYADLIEILSPLVARDPRNSDAMLDLAFAHAQANEHYDAIRYYERSRMVLREDTPALLNALATEYDAEGQPDKAVELLRRSLELDAEQPDIQRMLEQLAKPVTDTR